MHMSVLNEGVCMCVVAMCDVHAREQTQVSFLLRLPSMFFETGSLTGLEIAKDAGLAGQQTSGNLPLVPRH